MKKRTTLQNVKHIIHRVKNNEFSIKELEELWEVAKRMDDESHMYKSKELMFQSFVLLLTVGSALEDNRNQPK